MNIISCNQSHLEAWNDYVNRAPSGSFYHRFEWHEVNRRCFGHRSEFLAATDGTSITGVFPFVQLKSPLFGNIACSMPFVNYAGPCASAAETEAALIRRATEIVDDWRADYLEIRTRQALNAELPTSEHKVSLNVVLDPDPDKIWDAFKRDHRQEVRRAYKHGFVVRHGGAELLDDFFTVLSESWRDLGTPVYSKDYFKTIVDAFGPAVRLCVVYAGDTPAAAAFNGLHNGTIEGMWLGLRSEYRRQMVGYVLYWDMIKDACLNGYTKFHLGRSTAQSSAETFKKKWNGQTEQLYWSYVLRNRRAIPQLNPNNPKYRLAISAWQKLPVSVTKLVGPLLARSIP